MAKKKKVNHNNSLKDILGFDIFQNEKLNFFLGLALFGVALYLVISFVSFPVSYTHLTLPTICSV